jgi:uncharacterized lipoprotein NlpE involved in copper resistance
MKKLLFILMAATLFLCGCKKNNDDDINILTLEEKQTIISSYDAIDELVRNFNVENPSEYLKDIQAQPMVEKAYIDGLTLSVKFKKGGYAFWDWVHLTKMNKNNLKIII